MQPFGKFELLASLARGGMAEVFVARQRGEGRFERLVVIKRILPRLADDPKFVEMFLEEARIAALLEHPNVVPVYDFGRIGESYFIAMPFVHGLTVRRLLKEAAGLRAPPGVEVATEVVRQALLGLEYAHGLRGLDGAPLDLVHRDVSPSNLIVNDQGRVQLLDFGIASVADSASTDSGSVRGKVAYMSPEQVGGQRLDRRSDLFSLGLVYWELVLGERLFRRPTDLETMHAVRLASVPDPRRRRPDLPAPIAALLRRTLEKEPGRRYASAAEMRAELEDAVGSLGLATGEGAVRGYLSGQFRDLLDEQAARLRLVQDGGDDPEDEGETIVARPEAAAPRPSRRGVYLLAGAALVVAALAAALSYAWLGLEPAPDGPPLTMVMPPYLPEEVLVRDWAPVLRHLERAVDRPIALEVTLNYSDAADALASGRADLADLPSSAYVRARAADPAIAVLASSVRHKAATYESYLVVRRSDPAKVLGDLRGRRVCYVDRTSTSGYLVPRVMVRRAGHDPDEFFGSVQFSANHFRALQDLAAERCDVAAVTSPAFQSAPSEGLAVADLRVVEVSPPLPHGVFCGSSALPGDLVGRLRAALLAFETRRELGRETLSDVLPVTGFVRVEAAAFDELAREAGSASAGRPEGRPEQ